MWAKAAIGALAVAGAVTGLAMPASGAPARSPRALVVPVNCGGGGSFQVVVVGNGRWSVGHRVGSRATFHPISFGVFAGTFTRTGGTAVTITEPAVTKRTTAPNGAPVLNCTYTVSFSDASGTFSGGGGVKGYFVNL